MVLILLNLEICLLMLLSKNTRCKDNKGKVKVSLLGANKIEKKKETKIIIGNYWPNKMRNDEED